MPTVITALAELEANASPFRVSNLVAAVLDQCVHFCITHVIAVGPTRGRLGERFEDSVGVGHDLLSIALS
jgi:hypothetical protein